MLDSIESALVDLKLGKMIIVVDDEDRENEGDFIMATECISAEAVNFMTIQGRGLICVALTSDRCQELDLPTMVHSNTSMHETAFTVSVDLKAAETKTGISAYDRFRTIKALVDDDTKPSDLARPGHIFPLISKPGGVIRRAGHTEAAVDLARLAGMKPSGVLVEIMHEDGSMARLPQLMLIAKKFDLKLISIQDLIAFRLKSESLVMEEVRIQLPTKFGDFSLAAFYDMAERTEHLAIFKGNWTSETPVLVRVHSSCFTGDILGSLRCDCGDQLISALKMIEQEGRGVVLYMNQEGRGIGLMNKLKAYKLQEEGSDTVEANQKLGLPVDSRDYGIGAQILRKLGLSRILLLTNNPKKRVGLEAYGLEIVDTIPIMIEANTHNKQYLDTKRDKLGHFLAK